jgi:outer membrane protein assembly factor BamB
MYFVSEDHGAYCLDRFTGQLQWRHALGGICVAKPLLAEGRFFVAGFDSALTALDPETGIERWSLFLGEEVEYTSPQEPWKRRGARGR